MRWGNWCDLLHDIELLASRRDYYMIGCALDLSGRALSTTFCIELL